MSKLIAKGAEASLFLEDWFGYQVVRKHRIQKLYRIPQLDLKIRSERTIREARSLSSARRAGVATPIVFQVNPDTATIHMEFIGGPRVKEQLPSLREKDRRKLFKNIGKADEIKESRPGRSTVAEISPVMVRRGAGHDRLRAVVRPDSLHLTGDDVQGFIPAEAAVARFTPVLRVAVAPGVEVFPYQGIFKTGIGVDP